MVDEARVATQLPRNKRIIGFLMTIIVRKDSSRLHPPKRRLTASLEALFIYVKVLYGFRPFQRFRRAAALNDEFILRFVLHKTSLTVSEMLKATTRSLIKILASIPKSLRHSFLAEKFYLIYYDLGVERHNYL